MKLVRRAFSATSAAVLGLSTLMSIGMTGIAHAAPGSDTCTWIGASGGTFSTSSNWSGCSGGVPVSGDIIVLPNNGTADYTLTNDLSTTVALAGLTVGSASSTTYTNYTLDKLHFADGATIKSYLRTGVTMTDSITADGSLVFDGFPDFSADTKDITVNFTNVTYTNVASPCSGGGGAGYTFSWAPTGVATVGSGSTYSMNGTESSVIVQSGGLINLPYSTSSVSYAGNITFQGGGTTQGSACGQSLDYSMGVYSNTTLSGTITLGGGDIGYDISYGKTLTVTGTISGAGNSLKASADSAGTFVNNAATNSSSTPSGTSKPEVQTLAPITDDQPSQSLTVNANTIATLDGTRGSVFVSPGGVLKGTGTAQYLGVSGTVAPGHSPGKLTVLQTLSFYDGSTYQAELKDSAPGNFDQLVVGNAADTSGHDVSIAVGGGTTTLDVQLYAGANIKAGDTFKIIDNLSQTSVDGTFTGLPEGATFKVGNGTMKISYVGGDGNDVVLTAMTAISVPDTGFALMAAHPFATLGVTTVAAATIFGIARRSRKLAPARAKIGRR